MATKASQKLTAALNVSDCFPLVEPEKDPLIDLAEKGLAAVTDAIRVYYMVNFIPASKLIMSRLHLAVTNSHSDIK